MNFSIHYDLFTVSLLFIAFIIIDIIVASVEVYSIFSDSCETMLWL